MRASDLIVDGVSWAPMRRGDPLLHPTSFRAETGRLVGVVGPNGAGKSTLLRILYRYNVPHTGRVLIGGADLWSLSPRAAARKVAAVLQEQMTDFALSVREIVALGRVPHRQSLTANSGTDNAVIDTAMEQLGLSGLANRPIGTLSGGERQRVMVARALAQEPQLLILDEPTNHLDIRHQLEVLNLIRGLDMTIVTSLHDLNLAAGICDDILILNQGRALAYGPPDTVLTEQIVAEAFQVDAREDWLSRSEQRHFTFHRQIYRKPK